MIQTEKILERTRKLSRHEKKTILYRRDDVLCDLVTEGCYSGIPTLTCYDNGGCAS